MTRHQNGQQGTALQRIGLVALMTALMTFVLVLEPWSTIAPRSADHRLPLAGLFASIAVLLTVLQAQWLLSRRRNRAAQEQLARLATIVQNCSDAVVSQTSTGSVMFWNQAAQHLFGHSEAQALGADVVALLFPSHHASHHLLTADKLHALQGHAPIDTVCCHRDGHLIDVSLAVTALFTPSGDIAGSALLMRDIGRRKTHERSLLDLNARLEDTVRQRTMVLEKAEKDLWTVLNAVPAMIGYWDCDLFNRVANRGLYAAFGLAEGQIFGRSLQELMGPAWFERDRPFIEAALRGEPQHFEQSMPAPGGVGERHGLAQYIPDRLGDKVLGFYSIVHDITELYDSRRRLTAASRETEALIQTIKAHSIFSVADIQGRILDVNEGFCQISGYARDELLGLNHRVVSSRMHPTAFWEDMWNCIASGQPWRGEICNRAKNGSLYWVDSIIAPFFGASGRPEKYISMRHDITAVKRAAEALSTERERLENILNGTNVGTWEWNVQTGEMRLDERWSQTIGKTLGELAPIDIATWTTHVHPDDFNRAQVLLQCHFDQQTAFYECETRMRHREGHWVWGLDRGQVRTRTADGRPEWMYGTRQDIQARRAAEARLSESEAFLERVGVVAGVGGWQYDIRTEALTWTRQTRHISEVDDTYEPTLDKALDFYPDESRSAIARAMDEAIDHGRAFDLELAYCTASGRRLWVRCVGEAQHDAQAPEGSPIRVVGAFQDITERRLTSDALLQAKAAAESASAAKSAFLSNMSHEIRTPLNAVIGVTHLLADSTLTADQNLLLSKAQLAGRSLLGIVNDVLDLAKIEAGEISLDEGPYQPLALLDEIAAVYAPQAQEKGLSLSFEVAPDVPAWLQCDSSRLRQVLVNLVSNALKFTSIGGVQVKLSLTDLSDERCGLLVLVQDSGIGIDPSVQDRLFSPFIQADVSTTRRYGGTGLGLSIVRRLAQIMGGEVGLHSVPGIGSEFWATLPQSVPSSNAAEASSRGHALLEVLVVDDNPVDRLSLTSQVRALGWQARPLESGAALVREVMERHTSGRPLPDALLVDWQMPEMDGLQALAELAERVGPSQLPAALVVSAYERSRIAHLDHGGLADHILTKPVGSSSLFNAVNDSLARRQGTTERVLQSTRLDAIDTLWLADVRVLLVDDSDINLEVAKRLLERRGAQVRTCVSGRETLDCLRASPTAFDAVLMDVQMPDMDGLEATRCIRGELGLTALPVIALTAGALVEERKRAIDAGMQGFLPKPLDPAQLIRTLRRLVEAARGVALPVMGLEQATSQGVLDWPHIEGIDASDVQHRLGHDLPLFLLMLRRLLFEFEDLSRIESPAFADPLQRKALQARMHKLRGSAGTVGARELHQRAAVAEASLRDEDSGAEAAVREAASSLDALAELTQRALATRAPVGDLAEDRAEEFTGDPREALEGLAEQLRSRDLAALDAFSRLAPVLRRTLGDLATRALSDALDALEFAQASEILSGGLRSAPGVPASV